MLTIFDTDTILFKLLNGKVDIGGGIYKGDERPDDSTDEDIVINTIALTQTASPQTGTSNVNVYALDATKRIKGKLQPSTQTARLEKLAKQILNILRSADIPGCLATPGDMTLMKESTTGQHFVNIRVDWNIQTD